MGDDLITVVGVAVGLLVLVVGVIWSAKRERQARQLARWQQWEAMQALKASTPGAELAEIAAVYQSAQRGAKAVIVWLASGHRQDAWFEGYWPHPGCVVLLRGSTGWGPHNQNPDVFYVRPDQVLRMMSGATRKALRHQHWRETKRNVE